MARPDILILGAGLAGMAAGARLTARGLGCRILEGEAQPGGHARSVMQDGRVFDRGAHVFFGQDDVSRRLFRNGAALVDQQAQILNHYGADGRHPKHLGPYPIQTNLHAVKPKLAAECLVDAMQARAELADNDWEPNSYAGWCRKHFGNQLAERFLLRYARKFWTVEPEQLDVDWLVSSLGSRIPIPTLRQIAVGMATPQASNYITTFSYPTSGGFGALMIPLRRLVATSTPTTDAPELVTDAHVCAIDVTNRSVLTVPILAHYDWLISTLPLPDLLALCTDVPPDVLLAASLLRCTSIRCVNLAIKTDALVPGHWLYFYDEDVPFFRISFPHRLAPQNAPSGSASVQCEVSYSATKPLPDDLEARVIDALCAAGVVWCKDFLRVVGSIDLPHAYVIGDHDRAWAAKTCCDWLHDRGIVTAGRFGTWQNLWSFEAARSGEEAADIVATMCGTP